MPYNKLSDLPQSVRRHLPKHGQEIYLAAFNNAWKEYRCAADRRDEATREEVAHKVAWVAVKHQFEKRGDKWYRIQR
ncbi:MAG: hypothetical protein AMS22_10715 [Thiotrichales bacterium SG8_50]|nr:MAG: hypothetical protein AMS22_10715 [Thiotrichales bacterium SG8_50]